MPRIAPTLVIGLGGTGKGVIYDLRRRIAAAFGSVERMPFIRCLAIDTDVMEKVFESEDMPTEQDVELREGTDYLQLKMSPDDISEIQRRLKIEGDLPHLRSWLQEEALVLSSIDRGAGAVRQLGRLALLWEENFALVDGTINEALDDLYGAITSYVPDPNNPIKLAASAPEIYIVSSVMGGTGDAAEDQENRDLDTTIFG